MIWISLRSLKKAGFSGPAALSPFSGFPEFSGGHIPSEPEGSLWRWFWSLPLSVDLSRMPSVGEPGRCPPPPSLVDLPWGERVVGWSVGRVSFGGHWLVPEGGEMPRTPGGALAWLGGLSSVWAVACTLCVPL